MGIIVYFKPRCTSFKSVASASRGIWSKTLVAALWSDGGLQATALTSPHLPLKDFTIPEVSASREPTNSHLVDRREPFVKNADLRSTSRFYFGECVESLPWPSPMCSLKSGSGLTLPRRAWQCVASPAWRSLPDHFTPLAVTQLLQSLASESFFFSSFNVNNFALCSLNETSLGLPRTLIPIRNTLYFSNKACGQMYTPSALRTLGLL